MSQNILRWVALTTGIAGITAGAYLLLKPKKKVERRTNSNSVKPSKLNPEIHTEELYKQIRREEYEYNAFYSVQLI